MPPHLPIELVVRIWDNVPLHVKHEIYVQAAHCGDLTLLMWLDRYVGAPMPGYMDIYAAQQGHLHILDYLFRHHTSKASSSRAMNAAAAVGMLDTVVWCHRILYGQQQQQQQHLAEHINLQRNTLPVSARNGHLHVIKWAVETRGVKHIECHAFKQAARGGHLHLIRFMHETNMATERDEQQCNGQCLRDAMHDAAECGHPEVVDFLKDKWAYPQHVLRKLMIEATENERRRLLLSLSAVETD